MSPKGPEWEWRSATATAWVSGSPTPAGSLSARPAGRVTDRESESDLAGES
jgi:hypothetical protein